MCIKPNDYRVQNLLNLPNNEAKQTVRHTDTTVLPYNLFLFFHPLMDQRRKRVSLTIFQKVEILKKLQHGSSVKMIQEEYNVGKSTIYDLRSDKEKILQYAAECESANLMKNRKTMKPAKFDELDRVLYEWFKQRRSEGIPISGFILREKAREFHQTMDLEELL